MTPSGQSPGFVYLITDGKYCKIGFAKNVEQRFKTIQLATPYDLRIVDAIKTNDVRGLEAFLHGLFAGKHHRGEWYTHITEAEWKSKVAYAQRLLVDSYQERLHLVS
jgi:hypothetical protein